jgi:hypothetical protein
MKLNIFVFSLFSFFFLTSSLERSLAERGDMRLHPAMESWVGRGENCFVSEGQERETEICSRFLSPRAFREYNEIRKLAFSRQGTEEDRKRDGTPGRELLSRLSIPFIKNPQLKSLLCRDLFLENFLEKNKNKPHIFEWADFVSFAGAERQQANDLPRIIASNRENGRQGVLRFAVELPQVEDACSEEGGRELQGALEKAQLLFEAFLIEQGSGQPFDLEELLVNPHFAFEVLGTPGCDMQIERHRAEERKSSNNLQGRLSQMAAQPERDAEGNPILSQEVQASVKRLSEMDLFDPMGMNLTAEDLKAELNALLAMGIEVTPHGLYLNGKKLSAMDLTLMPENLEVWMSPEFRERANAYYEEQLNKLGISEEDFMRANRALVDLSRGHVSQHYLDNPPSKPSQYYFHDLFTGELTLVDGIEGLQYDPNTGAFHCIDDENCGMNFGSGMGMSSSDKGASEGSWFGSEGETFENFFED